MTDPLTGPGQQWGVGSALRRGRDPSVQIEDKFRICRGSTTRDERLKEGGRIRRVGPRTSRFFLHGSITITGDVSFIPIIVASLDDNDSRHWKALERRFHEITTNEWRRAGDREYCRVQRGPKWCSGSFMHLDDPAVSRSLWLLARPNIISSRRYEGARGVRGAQV